MKREHTLCRNPSGGEHCGDPITCETIFYAVGGRFPRIDTTPGAGRFELHHYEAVCPVCFAEANPEAVGAAPLLELVKFIYCLRCVPPATDGPGQLGPGGIDYPSLFGDLFAGSYSEGVPEIYLNYSPEYATLVQTTPFDWGEGAEVAPPPPTPEEAPAPLTGLRCMCNNCEGLARPRGRINRVTTAAPNPFLATPTPIADATILTTTPAPPGPATVQWRALQEAYNFYTVAPLEPRR